MEYKRLRPSKIRLDSDNPRLSDGTSDDKEAINRLLAEGYPQLLALAKDLADRGTGNPAELPIVIKDGSKYVVLEGNRRFAALKLVDNPRLADDPAQRSAFERIKQSGKQLPVNIFCVVVDSRDEADHWITLRHTGANEGVGVRVWNAEQTARHRNRMRRPVDSGTARSIAIADELTETYQADLELVNLIKKVRAEKLTNIGRFFSGVTLARMQLSLKQDTAGAPHTLWAKHTTDQLHDYFTWAFRFLDGNSVDAFKNDEVRGNVLNTLTDILPDPADSMAHPARLADHPFAPTSGSGGGAGTGSSGGTSGADGSGGGSSSGSGGGGDGDNDDDDDDDDGPSGGSSGGGSGGGAREERCLYSGARLTKLSRVVSRLLKETRTLPINDNYAVACVLARVILELAVSDPKALQLSGKVDGDTLAEKIKGCVLALDPDIASPRKRTRPDLVQALAEADGIGVTYLHMFIHNPHAIPAPQVARHFSSVFTPLLNSINQAMA